MSTLHDDSEDVWRKVDGANREEAVHTGQNKAKATKRIQKKLANNGTDLLLGPGCPSSPRQHPPGYRNPQKEGQVYPDEFSERGGVAGYLDSV